MAPRWIDNPWNGTDNPEVNYCIRGQMTFDKWTMTNRGKDRLFNYGAGKTRYPHVKE